MTRESKPGTRYRLIRSRKMVTDSGIKASAVNFDGKVVDPGYILGLVEYTDEEKRRSCSGRGMHLQLVSTANLVPIE